MTIIFRGEPMPTGSFLEGVLNELDIDDIFIAPLLGVDEVEPFVVYRSDAAQDD